MAISAAKRRNNDKYNAKCDEIRVKPLKPEGAAIRQAAADAGQSLQGYILQACRERMQRDAAAAQSLRRADLPGQTAEPAPGAADPANSGT